MASIDLHQLQQYSHLELLSKQVVEGFITGLHKSPFHGFSVEFAEHRIYNTGESTRHIDWKLYARTEKLFIKRFEEETNLRCQLIIDNSSSMYYPLKESLKDNQFSKIHFSIYCAAALIELLGRQRDAAGLSVFSQDVELHTPSKSTSMHHKYLFDQMEQLLEDKPDKKKTFAVQALHKIADNIHRRSLVIIFSDMMESSASKDDLFSSLQHLRHNKHEVILFHVTDKKKELDFEFENRPYQFIDVETGEEVKVHANEVKSNYLKAIKEYNKELMLKCGQYKIEFVEADIGEGFNQVLLPYLIKRSKML
ncbi:MAG: DUF58 domain-containing protein [Bacteroidetes bacterium]|nr:DUF58 domain-containing protein [Bacteroidota bacterium]HET6244478.1 DUF58 domain-containing protein [Bacteroidia bacterium]